MRPQIQVHVDSSDDISVNWHRAVTYPGSVAIEIQGRVSLYIEDRKQAYALALDIITALKRSEADEHKPTHVDVQPTTENYGTNVVDLRGVRL